MSNAEYIGFLKFKISTNAFTKYMRAPTGSQTTSSYTSSASSISSSSATSQRSAPVPPSTYTLVPQTPCPLKPQPTCSDANNSNDIGGRTKPNSMGCPPPSGATYRKMPVTNTTVTGTVYYRKLSKAEEVIRDLSKRPAVRASGDGATTTQRTAQEEPPPGRRGDEVVARGGGGKREAAVTRRAGENRPESANMNR